MRLRTPPARAGSVLALAFALFATPALAQNVGSPAATDASGFRSRGPTGTPTVPWPRRIHDFGRTPLEVGKGFNEFRVSYFDLQDSGDGNPFIDEDLNVLEASSTLEYQVDDWRGIWATFTYDLVDSNAVERPDDFAVLYSNENPDDVFAIDIGIRYRLLDTFRFGAAAHASQEDDYDSLGLSAYIEKDFLDGAATMKFEVEGFHDQIEVNRGIAAIGVDLGREDRDEVATALRWFQEIGESSEMELGAVFRYQTGFLETPFNDVVISNPFGPFITGLINARGTAAVEDLESIRLRYGINGRIRKNYESGLGLEFGGSFFTGSWGVTSFSVEPSIFFPVVKDKVEARIDYRYYIQSEADDYDSNFTFVTRHRTQDSNLSDFDSHSLGVGLDWTLGEDWSLQTGAAYITRDDDIDAVLVTTGLRYEF